MLNATDGTPLRPAFDQHSHSIEEKVARGSERFKESSFVETESLLTSSAVIAMFDKAMDFDVLGIDLCKVSTGVVIAPLVKRFHCASPIFARCVNVTSKMAFHGLAIQHRLIPAIEIPRRPSRSSHLEHRLELSIKELSRGVV